MALAFPRVRVAFVAVMLSVFLVPTAAPEPVQAAYTEAQRVTNWAKAQRGDPWRYGATGPHAFDCSGLVYASFKNTYLLTRIGGSRRTARGYYDYFRSRGLASRSGGRIGDLVIWGSGRHIGIYLGGGYAVSALSSGVKVHGIYNLSSSFTAFLKVRLSR